jgi:hypothetical protein
MAKLRMPSHRLVPKVPFNRLRFPPPGFPRRAAFFRVLSYQLSLWREKAGGVRKLQRSGNKGCLQVVIIAVDDRSLLEAALIGYQAEAAKLDKAIAEIQQRIGNIRGKAHSAKTAAAPRKEHRILAEGRRRIAAAQRRRWAAKKRAKA